MKSSMPCLEGLDEALVVLDAGQDENVDAAADLGLAQCPRHRQAIHLGHDPGRRSSTAGSPRASFRGPAGRWPPRTPRGLPWSEGSSGSSGSPDRHRRPARAASAPRLPKRYCRSRASPGSTARTGPARSVGTPSRLPHSCHSLTTWLHSRLSSSVPRDSLLPRMNNRGMMRRRSDSGARQASAMPLRQGKRPDERTAPRAFGKRRLIGNS